MTAEAADAANGAASSEQRQQWRRLADAATAGPWHARTDSVDDRAVIEVGEPGQWRPIAQGLSSGDDPESWVDESADMAFIAAARTAVPALLDALEAAEAEVAALKASTSKAADAAVPVVADALARYDYGDVPDDVERCDRLAQAAAAVAALREAGWLLPETAPAKPLDGEAQLAEIIDNETTAEGWHVIDNMDADDVREALKAALHRGLLPDNAEREWSVVGWADGATHPIRTTPGTEAMAQAALGRVHLMPHIAEAYAEVRLVGPWVRVAGTGTAGTADAVSVSSGDEQPVPPSGAASPETEQDTTAAEDNPSPRWAGLFGTDLGIVRSVSALAWCDVNGCRSRGRWYEIATRRHLCDGHVPPSPAAAQGEAGQA